MNDSTKKKKYEISVVWATPIQRYERTKRCTVGTLYVDVIVISSTSDLSSDYIIVIQKLAAEILI